MKKIIGNNIEKENNESSNVNNFSEEQSDVNNSGLSQPQTNVTVEIMPSNVSNKYTHEIFGVQLKNESDYNLSNEIIDLNVEYNKNDIMIFHTHTCESYTPTEQNNYQASGTFRTTDLNYSVVRVGDELEKYLVDYGYKVVHDKSYHDYPAYTGSYDRSIITVKNLLSTNQNTDIVIDLHRDGVSSQAGKRLAKIQGNNCAQLMFFNGLSYNNAGPITTLTNPYIEDNLAFSFQLFYHSKQKYDGLCTKTYLKAYRYNMHLCPKSLLVELGTQYNTVDEAKNSMEYFAELLNDVLTGKNK